MPNPQTSPDYRSLSVRRAKWLKPLRRSLEYWMVRWVLTLANRMSITGLQRLGRALGRMAYPLLRGERAICEYQLGLAFPGLAVVERQRLARRCFHHLGMTACEALALPRMRREGARWVHLEGEQALIDAHARGRGVMLITAHAGNWELLPVALERLNIKAVALVRTMHNPRTHALMLELRKTPLLEIAERGSSSSSRQMLACLKNGNALVMAIDQDIDAQGVFVDFFGIPAHTPRAPASLALKHDTPVVAYFDVRQPDGSHRILFRGIPVGTAVKEASDPVQALTQAIAVATEAHIRAYPEQWAWNHRRWKRRPPEETQGRSAQDPG